MISRVILMRHFEQNFKLYIRYKIISCPESVKNERYDRNAFKFNFGFVLRWEQDVDDSQVNL